jgi:hypothetical protein
MNECVYAIIIKPEEVNVSHKGHCDNNYKKCNKILHAKTTVFLDQDDPIDDRGKDPIPKSFKNDLCSSKQRGCSVIPPSIT